MSIKLFNSKVQKKFFVSVSGIVFCGASFIYLFFPYKEKNQLIKQYEHDSLILTEILGHSLINEMRSSDTEAAQQIIAIIKQYKHFKFALVLNNDNNSLVDYNKQNSYAYNGYVQQVLKKPDHTFMDCDDIWVMSSPIQAGNDRLGTIVLGVSKEEINSAIYVTKKVAFFFAVIIFAVGNLTFYLIAGKITKPLKLLEEGAHRVIAGDTDVEIETHTHDEIDDFAKVFNLMINKVKISLAAANQNAQAAQQAAEDAEAACAAALQKEQYLSTSIEKMLVHMNRFAAGDLMVRLEIDKNNDIGKLYSGLNEAINNIAYMVAKVDEASTAVANSGQEISTSIDQMSVGANEQSYQTTEVASSIEEMTKTIHESAINADFASETAIRAKEQANQGVHMVEETKKGMEAIVKSSLKTGEIIASLASKTDQIGRITQVINDIADQTNLLALNAAIEAARAGDQGRGFAVVADEVRKLAERTTKATKEIADMIKTIQNEAKEADSSMLEAREAVQQGMKHTEMVTTTFQDILKSIDTVSATSSQVAGAAKEQATASEQISKNIDSINSVT